MPCLQASWPGVRRCMRSVVAEEGNCAAQRKRSLHTDTHPSGFPLYRAGAEQRDNWHLVYLCSAADTAQ